MNEIELRIENCKLKLDLLYAQRLLVMNELEKLESSKALLVQESASTEENN